jgi:hypothetical protein
VFRRKFKKMMETQNSTLFLTRKSKLEIYDFTLFNILYEDAEELAEFFKNETKIDYENYPEGDEAAFCTYDKDKNIFLCIDVKHLNIEIIAHESFHAAIKIFRFIGENEISLSEVTAYLLGYIAGEFEKLLIENNLMNPLKQIKNEK